MLRTSGWSGTSLEIHGCHTLYHAIQNKIGAWTFLSCNIVLPVVGPRHTYTAPTPLKSSSGQQPTAFQQDETGCGPKISESGTDSIGNPLYPTLLFAMKEWELCSELQKYSKQNQVDHTRTFPYKDVVASFLASCLTSERTFEQSSRIESCTSLPALSPEM